MFYGIFSVLQVKRELASVLIFESHAKAGTVCKFTHCVIFHFVKVALLLVRLDGETVEKSRGRRVLP